MSRSLKNIRGITLVALVITVIVLLILAAVTISALSGDNGILKRATEAKQKTERAETLEEIQMVIMKATANGIGNVDKSNLRAELEQVGATVKTEGDNLPWEIVSGNYMLRINEDLSIDEVGKTVSVTAADIAANKEKYYGQIAQNYTAGGLTYKIFYVDTENKFGDGTNTVYLKADYKDTKSLTTDISGLTTDDIQKFKNMNPVWNVARGTVAQSSWNTNEKGAAWLCAPSQWKTYVDNTKATYAMGGPSVEMYIASYNDVPHTEVGNYTLGAEYKNDGGDHGYRYTLNGAQSTISNSDYYTGTDSLDYKGYNSMYAGKNGSKTGYWWLASPSSGYSGSVCYVYGNYAYLDSGFSSNAYGVGPLVSLKSGIPVQVEE